MRTSKDELDMVIEEIQAQPLTKLEAYKVGLYKFKCPSVTTHLWTDQDWINWIDSFNGWTVTVIDN